MGEYFQFTCANCGFIAEVSGGDDTGMHVVTTTIICQDCHRLYDVEVAEITALPDPKPRSVRCPKSARHTVDRWASGGPCPKCGNALVKGESVCLWD